MALQYIIPAAIAGTAAVLGSNFLADQAGVDTHSYTDVNNSDSPFSWAYDVHKRAHNTLIPSTADYYKKVTEGTIAPESQMFGWDPTPKNSRVDKAAEALAEIYNQKRALGRLPVDSQYFQKAAHFLQNLEHTSPIYSIVPFNPVTAPLYRLLHGDRTKELGFTGKDQVQDVADLAEIHSIFDKFGSNNTKNQFNEYGNSPSIFSWGMTDTDRTKFGDTYKILSKALRNGDYTAFKPYLTSAGYSDLLRSRTAMFKSDFKNAIEAVKQSQPVSMDTAKEMMGLAGTAQGNKQKDSDTSSFGDASVIQRSASAFKKKKVDSEEQKNAN